MPKLGKKVQKLCKLDKFTQIIFGPMSFVSMKIVHILFMHVGPSTIIRTTTSVTNAWFSIFGFTYITTFIIHHGDMNKFEINLMNKKYLKTIHNYFWKLFNVNL
jgi:hypothetical protein